MDFTNISIDLSDQWFESNDCAEFEAWLDSQEVRYPEPSNILKNEDYQDDF